MLEIGKELKWDSFERKICKVVTFVPNAKYANGKVISKGLKPYAFVIFESEQNNSQIKAPIFHKEDFKNLCKAIEERGTKEEEEILFSWLNHDYKKIFSLFKVFLPKLHIMICPKNSFRIITDSSYLPQLNGEARFLAFKPKFEIKPRVML